MSFLQRHPLPFLLGLSLAGLTTIGLLSLKSAEYGTANHWIHLQSIAFALAWSIGTLTFVVIHPWRWRIVPYLFYLLGFGLLASLFVFGTSVAGHQSWIRLGPLSFQPSELAKVALIILLSFRLAAQEKSTHHWIKPLMELILWSGLMAALVIAEGDLGTSLLFMATFGAALFLYPFPRRLLFIVIIAGIALSAITYQVALSPYQKARVQTFLHPEADPRGSGYQVTQAKITVGSGQFWGKGYQNGKHHQLHYLPARHSDFIFCVWAEEWGLVGASALLLFYATLFSLLIYLARTTPFREGYYLAMFTFWHFLVHITVNLGGVLGLLPLTGVPLPLISYGGSAVISNVMVVAIAASYWRAPQRLKDYQLKTIAIL